MARASDPYANYSTAASLGITDPDEERRKAEAEMRRNEGVIGAWEVVAVEESAAAGEAGEEQEAETPEDEAAADVPPASAQPTLKREADVPPDEDDARQFRFRRKKLNTGLGEIYDPGLIPVKLKAKKEEPAEPILKGEGSSALVKLAPSISNPHATALPKWSARGWSKPGEAKQPEAPPAGSAQAAPEAAETPSAGENTPPAEVQQLNEVHEEHAVKAEAPEIKVEESSAVKTEPDTVTSMAPPSLFKKRKAPAGSAGSRGRR